MKKSLENLKINARGYVEIFNAETGELLWGGKNAIQPFALKSVARLLLKDTSFAPEEFRLFDTGVNVGVFPITARIPVSDTVIRYECLIPPADPLTAVTEMDLMASTGDVFSAITGVNFTKAINTSILLTWTLTIS